MALKITSADERLAQPTKINIAIFGPSGVGKTSQARTLNPDDSLFIDYEAGTLALQDWRGDTLDAYAKAVELGIDPWTLSRALACLLAGPDPSDLDGPYSRKAYDYYAEHILDPASINKYRTIFIDSITVASRACFAWAKRQPEAFNKNGVLDTRGAYGVLGQEMVRWLTMLQHVSGKSMIVVGILDRIVDDLDRVSWVPQIEGGKTGRELGGIFDQVLTLQTFTTDEGKPYRAFVTQQMNPAGYPAKDRSGRLDPIEPPDLGKLLRKIHEANRTVGVPAITTTIAADAANKE